MNPLVTTDSIPSPHMVSPSITPQAMQNAIDFAKQDPTSSYAQELQQRIQAGNYNDVLKLMGKDTSKYGPQPSAAVAPVTTPVETIAAPVEKTVENYSSDLQPAAEDLVGGGNVKKAEDNFEAGKIAPAVEDSTLGVASDAVGAIFAPIAAPLQTLIAHNVKAQGSAPYVGENDSPEALAARTSIRNWAEAHPDIAKTIGDAINVGGAAVGSEALDTPVSAVTGAVKDGISSAADTVTDTASQVAPKIKEAIVGTPGQQATRIAAQAAKDTNTTITALDPDLKGAKLTAAYKEAITGNRTITPSGVFSEQALSPGQRTVGLGQRLSSDVPLTEGDNIPKVILTKNPVKNTAILRQALTDTETKLTAALRGDPDINYNADKQTLFENLDTARKNAPNEFRIGENKAMTQNVFNFANKVASDAEDSIEGLRDARTAFDTQARTQYPNAFNPDGSVNVKTAAGNAVKTARDVFNEHLYNTAPKGSDIQKLIGREADLFQASNPVASKAAAGEGENLISKTINAVKTHPKVAAGAAAYEIAKHTLAPSLPGI